MRYSYFQPLVLSNDARQEIDTVNAQGRNPLKPFSYKHLENRSIGTRYAFAEGGPAMTMNTLAKIWATIRMVVREATRDSRL
jgi:hypothetical protein